jgi:hypothetical protein
MYKFRNRLAGVVHQGECGCGAADCRGPVVPADQDSHVKGSTTRGSLISYLPIPLLLRGEVQPRCLGRAGGATSETSATGWTVNIACPI